MPADISLYRRIPRPVATFIARARTSHLMTQTYFKWFIISNFSFVYCLWKRKWNHQTHTIILCNLNSSKRQAKDEILEPNATVLFLLRNWQYWMLVIMIYERHEPLGSSDSESSNRFFKLFIYYQKCTH